MPQDASLFDGHRLAAAKPAGPTYLMARPRYALLAGLALGVHEPALAPAFLAAGDGCIAPEEALQESNHRFVLSENQ